MNSRENVDTHGKTKNRKASPIATGLDDLLHLNGIQFVEGAYRTLLLRQPDESGMRFYLTRLLSGTPKIQILSEIFSSEEARDLAVTLPGLVAAIRWYRLSRIPIFGAVIRSFPNVESNSVLATRLRAVEQEIYSNHRSFDLQLSKLESARKELYSNSRYFELQLSKLESEKKEKDNSITTPGANSQAPEIAPAAHSFAHADTPVDLHALIQNSDLFDPKWYVEQLPPLDHDIDVVSHFLRHGGIQGRSPSSKFDSEWYLSRFADVREAGVNPLVHFLLNGEREGRFPTAEAERSARLQALPITAAEIHCLKSLQITGEAGVFVTHSPDGNIKPHVSHYLSALKRHGVSVVLIVAADRPVKTIPPDLMSLVSGLFVRENKGYDFAAWAHVLQLHPTLFASPILYLMNDSLFGPLNDKKFASLLGRIRHSRADVVGLTDSYEHNWHIQSFFLAFKPRALSSVALHRFINAISCCSDKDAVIKNYEITLAPHLRERGLKIEALFGGANNVSKDNRFNRTLFHWRELIQDGFPFVKVMALRNASLDKDMNDWRQILTKEGYDVSLVDRTLSTTMRHNAVEIQALNDHRTDVAPLVSGPRFTSTEPPRVAFIGPWNYDNGLGFASRGYVSALWHTDFSVNVHPIRAPFHVHRRMAPTVDVRTFSGDADLVVVHLNPDAWPGLLSEEHRSIMSNARKVVGIWVWETTKIPDNWFPMFDTVDAIWAPSRYCADVFETSAKVPVEVVQHVINVRSSHPDHVPAQSIRREMGVMGDQRIILYCFDGASYLVRKNPFGLISGFARSGLAREGWVLVLKTKYLFDSPAQGRRLKEETEQHSGVVLIDRSFDRTMMGELMSVADIYASPHCSEGFGMTIAEAMAAGKLVVATDYGGSRDFLDETCGYPVRYRLRTLEEDHGHYTRGSIWADIDEADLASALRKAAEKVVSGDLSIGQTARDRIGLQFSPQAVGRVMQQAATTLLKNRS
jgi:glycosyltransferase involved in cell wall biosynthesis